MDGSIVGVVAALLGLAIPAFVLFLIVYYAVRLALRHEGRRKD